MANITNGTVSVTITGGVGPYRYTLLDAGNLQPIPQDAYATFTNPINNVSQESITFGDSTDETGNSGLVSGSYRVRVIDGNDCITISGELIVSDEAVDLCAAFGVASSSTSLATNNCDIFTVDNTTITDTATPVPEPTATDVPDPTATPVPDPTATDVPDPTATPVPDPTATDVPDPTATPEPAATENSYANYFTWYITEPVPRTTNDSWQQMCSLPISKELMIEGAGNPLDSGMSNIGQKVFRNPDGSLYQLPGDNTVALNGYWVVAIRGDLYPQYIGAIAGEVDFTGTPYGGMMRLSTGNDSSGNVGAQQWYGSAGEWNGPALCPTP